MYVKLGKSIILKMYITFKTLVNHVFIQYLGFLCSFIFSFVFFVVRPDQFFFFLEVYTKWNTFYSSFPDLILDPIQ